MQWTRFADIALIRTDSGRVWGFHPHNLAIAELPAQITPELESELRAWNEEVDPNTQDALPDLSRPVLSLNIAQVCNLHCNYCAAGGDGTYGSSIKSLDLTLGETVIRKFLNPYLIKKQNTHLQIHFLGGEPLLYPELIRHFCQYALLMTAGSSVTLGFSVTTNGTLFRDKTLEVLAQFHFSVTVSIDGPAAVQNKNRPSKGKKTSTQLVEEGLVQLNKIRTQLGRLTVNSVFGSHNTDVVGTYNYLRGLPIHFEEYNFNFSNSDKDESANAKYLSSMTELAQVITSDGELSELAKIAQFQRPLARILSATRHHNYCGANQTLTQVDTRGDAYDCNWFIGEENEKRALVREPKNTSMIDGHNCQSCWARHLCAGGCMAVHKAYSSDKTQKDPQFCLRSRTLAALAITSYAEIALNDADVQNEMKSN